MPLIEINTARYRQRLNIIIIAIISFLVIASLSISQVLIAIYPSSQGSHFHWNLLGVVISALLVLISLKKLKTQPYFYEVSYVWDLKLQLNKINRYRNNIETQAQQGDANAMQIMHYCYCGSRQLWQLDNNTLTINHLTQLQNELSALAEAQQVTLDTNTFSPSLIKAYT